MRYDTNTKYTFTCKSPDGDVTTLSTESLTWKELTEVYVRFLRGCGFVLPGKYDAELVFEGEDTP